MLVGRRDTGGVACLTLDSPGNRNALSRHLVDQLHEHLVDIEADVAVRAVILRATGSTFCSGADLSDPPVARHGSVGYPDVLRRLWDCRTPVVAVVEGHVRAGGLGMLACADIVISTTAASYAFSEVRLGVAPAIISVVCQRRMTPAAASRYMLTGERFGAAEARKAGLVSIVTEPDGADAALDGILDDIRQTEPGAAAVTRRLLRALPAMEVSVGLDYAEAVSQRLFASDAAAEGINAFKERRPPRWALGEEST